MKNVVLMVFTGIALFLGAMDGLLAAQGRLTYEGTRNIPILSSLFKKPASESDGDDQGKEAKAGKKKSGGKVLPYKKGSTTPDKSGSDGIADPNAIGDGQSIIREPEPAMFWLDYGTNVYDSE